jgi:methylase of polypeptide subunit release factors
MANRFQQILRGIGKACEAKQLTEAEVEKLFQEKGFFVELGYQGIGKDILAQRGRARKRYDVGLLGFGGRVRAVIEFKQAAAGALESFRRELLEKYVLPHLAVFGVLTNGVDFVVYARTNGEFVEQRNCTFRLSEASEAQARDVEDWLKKKVVSLDSLDSVLDLLKFNRQQALLISAPDSEPAQIFFQVFQLRPESAFGRVVQALKDLLPKTIESSRFTRGSYEFWQKTFARDLKFKDVPASWRPFLASKASAEIAQFSFALETAYTIISRLMLAKAADDRRFPGVRFVPRIQESFSELSTRGRLTAENHLEVIKRTFERAGQTLFHSIFSQDIFDWWHECPVAEGRPLFHALSEAMLVVTQFDFADLSGDLLGELYQRYFDRDTRKALGEFYTPAEAIEFILDECGYRGQRGDRLLDPACGSGSFLAAALRRYLKQQTGTDAKKVLLDLTEGLRIVGFDINPFAVLMAQVNYAALILPLYAEAIFSDPDFRIVRLPVFRTDSLRIEEREAAAEKRPRETLQVSLSFEPGILKISVDLPIKGEKKGFVRMPVKVPRYQDARQQNLVSNLEDYVAALSRVFQAVRDRRHTLETLLRTRFAERAEKLHAYLVPTLQALEASVAELKGKYDDGRFLKTIEDLVLAVSLKHDLQYDFVVGNPPYVRIQKIPEHVKEYWAGKYEWTEHNYDLYIPFLERAVRSADREGWLGKGGRLGFILSDRFLNVNYGEKLRQHMPESLRVDLLCDFRDTRVFAGALNYPAILIGQRHGKGKEGEFQAVRVFTSDIEFGELLTQFNALRKKVDGENTARGASVEVFSSPRARLAGEGWWLMPADERHVFDKLRQAQASS